MVGAGSAFAEDPANSDAKRTTDHEVDSARARLERRGLTYAGEYVGEYSTVVDGGLDEAGAGRNLLTLDLELDLSTSLGLDGGTFFSQFLSVNAEKGGTADSGDIQVYSNIENDRSLSVIYEAWYQQLMFDDRLRIKVGKVDANSEFNVVEAAGEFSNSSAGFSPTIVGFPTYPDPGMSVNLFVDVARHESHHLTLGYGFYDGAAAVDGVGIGSRGPSTFFDDNKSDDYFHIIEAGLSWEGLGSWSGGRLAIGGWRHTGDFDTFAGNVADGTEGFYALVEQRIVEVAGPEGEKSLDLFVQGGSADDEISEIDLHLAAGLVARGWVLGRSQDTFGLYVTLAGLSGDTGAGFSGDEVALDVFYRANFGTGFFLQPELHFIASPGGNANVPDASILALRAGFAF